MSHSTPSHRSPKQSWLPLFRQDAPPAQAHSKSAPSWYSGLAAYVYPTGTAVWSGREYCKFAEEAYRKNVVANQAITMIARGVASVSILAYESLDDGTRAEVNPAHPLLSLLTQPNPLQGKATFFEALVSYYLLAGNAYVQAVSPTGEPPHELHLLRPDRVKVVAGKRGIPLGYHYCVDDRTTTFPVDSITGTSRILHFKHFNPLSDWHGLAPIEAAAYSIDQHNQAAVWNQALLQNGARPSGALVMKMGEGGTGRLSEDQYNRLKQQVDDQFSGAGNAGRPLLLEGGLEWKEMSLSPRDMDFLNIKHSAARDIALAFGVPPQLLGIPGDNTYANLAEARLALWEQTILPLASMVLQELSRWLNPMLGTSAVAEMDLDTIPALALRREKLWQQVAAATFLSDAEKRQMLGFNQGVMPA
jgi:HK97 family phage portal protein